ncbi:unnamed protein product, partial [marine sediment metagenome]
PLGLLKPEDLRNFGSTLDKSFSPGIKTLPRDLKKIVKEYDNVVREFNVDIEFYIISSGLLEIIEGSKFIRDNFSGIYASQLGVDENGILSYIKRCITFTEKTRYLFEINKGISIEDTRKMPYLVNKKIPYEERRIPLSNFIYIGDGQTDVPCFSLLEQFGGKSFGVFNPKDKKSAKRALIEFIVPQRVSLGFYEPKYRKEDPLGSLLRLTVESRVSDIHVEKGVTR